MKIDIVNFHKLEKEEILFLDPTLLYNLIPSEIEDMNTYNFICRCKNVGLDIIASDYIYSIRNINERQSTFIEEMSFIKFYFKIYQLI